MSARKIKSFPEIGKRTLSPEHIAQAQEAIFLINHHKQIVAQIETRLADILKEAYGVDIRLGQWKIDFATGTLAQEMAPAEKAP